MKYYLVDEHTLKALLRAEHEVAIMDKAGADNLVWLSEAYEDHLIECMSVLKVMGGMSFDALRDIIEAESYDLDSLVEDQIHEFWTPYVERCGRECQFNFKARPKSTPVDNH